MITAHRLTKTYGDRTAVDGVSFTVEPGRVTGFLGPNGAGKSTTMRMVLGLDRPTSGSVTVNGRRYADSPHRCARSARCWRPAPSTRAARPATTCGGWRSATSSRGPASTRWPTWWA